MADDQRGPAEVDQRGPARARRAGVQSAHITVMMAFGWESEIDEERGDG